MPAINGPDSTKRGSVLDARSAPRRGEDRQSDLNPIRCEAVRLEPDWRQSKELERCQSGRMGLTRNQVCGSPVPWVRIPPSPPINKKGPTGPLFVYSWKGVLDSDPPGSTKRASVLDARSAPRRGENRPSDSSQSHSHSHLDLKRRAAAHRAPFCLFVEGGAGFRPTRFDKTRQRFGRAQRAPQGRESPKRFESIPQPPSPRSKKTCSPPTGPLIVYSPERVLDSNPPGSTKRASVLDARSAPRRGENRPSDSSQSHPLRQKTKRPLNGAFFCNRACEFETVMACVDRHSLAPRNESSLR